MSSIRQHIPNKTIFKLVVAWAVVVIFLVGGPTWLHDPIDPLVAVICFLVIFGTILLAAFGVVHEADYLANLLTVGLTALTFIGQRASALQGTLHLTLFAVFGVLLFLN